jgi:hypothetical protein
MVYENLLIGSEVIREKPTLGRDNTDSAKIRTAG